MLRAYGRDLPRLGPGAASRLFLADASLRVRQSLGLPRRAGEGSLRLKGLPHPVAFRPGTSDVYAIRNVFTREEYPLAGLQGVRSILDCGANIGAASIWFLRAFPEARLAAVEPDPGNFALLRRNLAPYGGRAAAVQAAVWPSGAPLRLRRGAFRDGLEWSSQVAPPSGGEGGDVRAVTIPQLMSGHGFGEIDLLKIDIERSEIALFSGGCGEWLPRVRNILIELHDGECREAFFRALAGCRYRLEEGKAVTACRDIRREEGSPPGRA